MGNEICCSNKPEQEEINSIKHNSNIIQNEKASENSRPISLKINFMKNQIVENKDENDDMNIDNDIISNDDFVYEINDNIEKYNKEQKEKEEKKLKIINNNNYLNNKNVNNSNKKLNDNEDIPKNNLKTNKILEEINKQSTAFNNNNKITNSNIKITDNNIKISQNSNSTLKDNTQYTSFNNTKKNDNLDEIIKELNQDNSKSDNIKTKKNEIPFKNIDYFSNNINNKKDKDKNQIINSLMIKDNEIIHNKNISENNISLYTNNNIIQNNNKNQQSLNINENMENIHQKDDKPDENSIYFTQKEIEYIFNEGEKKYQLLKQGKNPNITDNENFIKFLKKSKSSKEFKSHNSNAEEEEYSKSTKSYREIQPIQNKTFKEKPQFRQGQINSEKTLTKENKIIEQTIVRKPVVYTTVSPKKYVQKINPQKTQIIQSKPQYFPMIQSPTKTEFKINKNFEIMTENDLNNYLKSINNNNKNVINSTNINNIKNDDINNNYSNINNNYYNYENNIEKKDNYILSSLQNNNINNNNKSNSLINSSENNLIKDEISQSNIDSINNASKQEIKKENPVILNIFNQLNSSVKTSESYIQYINDDEINKEKNDFNPINETRNLTENSSLIINNKMDQNQNYEKSIDKENNFSKVISSPMTNEESFNYRPQTQFELYKQSNQFQKTQKLNFNKDYDLISIKKAKSFDNKNKIPHIYSEYSNINNLNNNINLEENTNKFFNSSNMSKFNNKNLSGSKEFLYNSEIFNEY